MRAYVKDLLRTLTGSISRFISIVIIVALGVFFFVGIRAASPDMKETVGQYIEAQNIYDIHILANYGFSEDDVKAIEDLDGVKQVDAVYSIDMLCQKDDENLIVTLEQLPSEGELNQVKLIDGRLPEKDDECLVDTVFLRKNDFNIGDTINLQTGDDQDSDQVKITSYKIVGSVTSPLYISLLDRGASTLGSGKVSGYIMVNKDVFDLDVYTDIYISLETTVGQSALYDDYITSLEPIYEKVKELGNERAHFRYDEIKNEAQEKLDDATKKVADAEKELADAKAKLDDAKKQIEDGEDQLAGAKEKYNSEIASWQKQLDDAKAQLDDAKKQIDENEATLNASQSAIDDGKKQIEDGLAEIASNKITLEAQKPYMTEEQYNTALAALNSSEADLLAKQKELQDNQTAVTEGFAQLAAAKQEYEAGLSTYNENLKKFEDGKASGQKELSDAAATLKKAKQDYNEGLSEYNEKSVTAKADIEKAKEDIADGQKKIDELVEAKWYVSKVSDLAGVSSYKQDTERLASIGDVFPVMFFLVAALVCLTVMTRMVEEDRTKIGTFKALGYRKRDILIKYILYALLASVLGSVLGALVGFNLLPRIITKAYSSLYEVPSVLTPIRSDLQFEATAFGIIATTIPTLIVTLKELSHNPATLMRPKAPKAGKRILLENIPMIWKRLSFTKKVTLRNLFRYKARFIMTLLGIAGCTMLLLIGFGLNDSIEGIVEKSFVEIAKYDALVILPSSKNLDNILVSDDRISSMLYVSREYIDVSRDQTKETGIQLVVPKDDISSFVNLRTMGNNEKLELGDTGVIITKKLAELLNIQVGSTITLQNDDEGRKASVTVTGIAENYVGHYAYMSENSYKAAFGTEAKTNAALIMIKDSATNEKGLSEDLLSAGALNVTLTSSLIESFNDSIGNVTYVVFVLILSAAALAFVVLFSLTSINIDERIRELATIKVLGFYDREVSSYVYRENFLLTVLGALLGLVFGVFMHGYILTTMEKDVLKFTRYISPQSYMYAFLLTIGFSLIVNLIMNRRLKKIDMVESLKSNE